MKTHVLKFLVSEEKYQEIIEYIKNKEYDSLSSFMRYCTTYEMKRNPMGPGKPKKNKNVKITG